MRNAEIPPLGPRIEGVGDLCRLAFAARLKRQPRRIVLLFDSSISTKAKLARAMVAPIKMEVAMLSTDKLLVVIATFALSGLALGNNAHAADGIKILEDISNQQAEDAKEAAEDKKAKKKQLTAPQQTPSDIPITKEYDKASP